MAYLWTSGYPANVDAEAAGEALEALAARHGEVQAAAIVNAARPEGSPLHPGFEWDDAVAAEKHREEQARDMTRSLRIVIEDNGPPERVFFNVQTSEVKGYVTKARILSDAGLHHHVLECALRDLNAVRSRYQELSELHPLWQTLDELELAS